jgi:SRSO17 transposase
MPTLGTQPEIALDEIQGALAAGVPRGVVLADAGYGVDTAFRTKLTAMGLPYVVGIQSSTSLWPPGSGPLPPKAWSGHGRPPSLVRRHPEHKPVSAKQLAQTLPGSAWHIVTWREGSNASLTSKGVENMDGVTSSTSRRSCRLSRVLCMLSPPFESCSSFLGSYPTSNNIRRLQRATCQ